MSDTPRTDAHNWNEGHYDDPLHSLSDFAKQLERELNAANERINRLKKDSERLQWLLNRGLAWRDCYDDNWIEGEWLYAEQDALATIDKAKEAKP